MMNENTKKNKILLCLIIVFCVLAVVLSTVAFYGIKTALAKIKQVKITSLQNEISALENTIDTLEDEKQSLEYDKTNTFFEESFSQNYYDKNRQTKDIGNKIQTARLELFKKKATLKKLQ